MSLLCILLAAIVVTGYATPVERERYVEGQRWMYFPDDEGVMHLVDLEEFEPQLRYDAEKSVKFFLHTRNNPREEIIFGDNEALQLTHYDPSKPVKMFAHGWNSDGTSDINKILTEAFLKSEDVNAIVIDWGKGANTLYNSACSNVVKVGILVAEFIDWLNSLGTPVNAFHLMGHSLGGHLVGIAGRHITTGKLPYITSLDPANPLWGKNSERIRVTDADYVEVIHTDAGYLGLEEPIGHADFYPNKGHSQPGCFLSVGCSHGRAYEFLADSIDHHGFMSQKCHDFTEMNKGKCANLSQIHMGGSHPKFADGVYYLETNKNKPFYLN